MLHETKRENYDWISYKNPVLKIYSYVRSNV